MLKNATFIVIVFTCVCFSSVSGNKRRPIVRVKDMPPARSPGPGELYDPICRPRNRCPRNMTQFDSRIKMRNCFCDPACKIYNDCCRNYKAPELGETDGIITSGFKIPEGLMSCEVYRHISQNYVYVINKCPKSFKNKQIKDKCERYGHENDVFTKIPVTDRFTGFLFRNAYCAMCFGDNVDFTYWNVNVTCSPPFCPYSREEWTVNASRIIKSVFSQVNFFGSGLQIDFYHKNYTYRNCKRHISQCDESWTNKRIAKQCRGPTAYVYQMGTSRTYRNIFCALCNFINESTLTCKDTSKSGVGEGSGDPPLSSFAILLDINGGNSKVGQYGEREEIKEVEKVITCNKGEVYDPFASKCRRIGCNEGFILSEGDCRRDPSYNVKSETDDVDGVDSIIEIPRLDVTECSRISLNRSEYIKLSNNSIMVPLFGEVYAPNEYRIDNGFASICSPFTEQNYTLKENVTTYVKMFKFDSAQSFVSFIGTIVSLFALLLHFVVYMCLPPLRNIPGKCLICLVVCLFVGQLLFLVGTPQTDIPNLCVALAVIMHYALLASFFWMNVMAFDIWRTFTPDSFQSPSDERAKRFTWYSIYAWMGPVFVVTVGLLFHFLDPWLPIEDIYRPHYGDGLCWITHRLPLLFLFAAPVAALLFFNIILYILTIKNLCILSENAKMVDNSSKWRFVLYVKLSFIMGLTWVFGFIATSLDLAVLWYVFIVFNSLQGAFICLAFVCTKKVYRLVSEKIKPGQRRPSRSSDSRYAVNSSRTANYTRQTTLLYEPQAKVVSQETSI